MMMVSLWKERGQQYADQMGDGAPLQSAGKLQVASVIKYLRYVWIINKMPIQKA